MKKYFYLLLLLPLPFFAASCGGAKAPHDTEKTRANRLRPPAEVQTQPAAESATTAKIKNILLNNSVFWSRLGWAYNPPRLDENGKTVMLVQDDSPERRFHRDFKNAGVKIHSTILFSGWVAPGKYDYSATDETLEKLFGGAGADILYIPRIKLDPPPAWCAENPEDTTVYYPGRLSKEEIAELACTPAHDWSGMEWPKGYNAYGNPRDRVDDRPNVMGLIGLQSFSSEKWLRDAGEALRRLIRRIEGGKYAKNVIAYHIAYGQTGETAFWRAWEKNDYRFGDYGINNLRAFYDWGIKKYGSREALAKAWKQPEISRGNVKLPTPMRRELHWNSHAEFFRASEEDRICIDYEKFCGEINVRAIEYFSKIVKEESGKAAGAFYGYYLNVPRAAYSGHLEFDALLKSPNVDFLAAPKGYRNYGPASAGSVQTPPMSINRKKIFISEIDPPTHLVKWSPAKNMEGTRTVLRREFASAMQSGSGFWWMDLGGGWYDSPEIMGEIGEIEKAAAKIRARKAEPVAEVLIVSDPESFYYSKPHWMLHQDLLKDSIIQIRKAGAPVDHYRLADLKDLDLSRYRAVAFMNCARIADSDWEEISKRLRPDATLIWHHAPAVWGEKYDPARSVKITGFKLAKRPASKAETIRFSGAAAKPLKKDFAATTAEFFPPHPNPEKPYPTFSADPSNGAEVLAKYSDGSAAFAKIKRGERTCYFVSIPIFKAETYRKIFDAAGVRAPAPAGCAVYADSRFTAFFPSRDAEAKLSGKAAQKDLFTGEKYAGGQTVKLKAGRALILETEE